MLLARAAPELASSSTAATARRFLMRMRLRMSKSSSGVSKFVFVLYSLPFSKSTVEILDGSGETISTVPLANGATVPLSKLVIEITCGAEGCDLETPAGRRGLATLAVLIGAATLAGGLVAATLSPGVAGAATAISSGVERSGFGGGGGACCAV